MRSAGMLASALLLRATTGCRVYSHGSAPAGKEQIYGGGGEQGFFTTKSKAWLCPADGSQAKCEEVEVVRE